MISIRTMRGAWRRRLAVPAVLAMTLAGLVGVSVMTTASAALNQGVLELEGDATDSAAVAGIDWDTVYAAQVPSDDCPTGATACAWENDGAANATIFTGGGSKDPEDLSAWKWKDQSGGLPDKDNLLHSFAARFTDSDANELLYFGSDRFDNSGDAHQAFWFFQDEVSLNANGTFSGLHTDGDLLVISEFSNGGAVSTIVVYKWVDAVSGNLQKLAEGTNAKCDPALVQSFCGIVNPANGTASPWPFLDKRSNTSFAQGEFFEGGINLSDPAIGLGGQCFASFASETRSSTSTTAVLKDFVLGGFGQCGSETVTTPVLADGTTPIPSGGVSIGTDGSVDVRDSAEVSVSGGNVVPTGSVAFSLCGPTATDSTALCTEGGTAVGTTTVTSLTNPTTVVSPTATVTAAGRYCFRAEYSGNDAGVPPSSDSSATECFLVTPVQPTLSTQAGAGPVSLGNPITDTATLSGTAQAPGTPVINPTTAGGAADGTITFSLRDAACNAVPGFTAIVEQVDGDGTYGPVQFTPTAVGTYNWVATYSGDSPNTLGVTHNALCTDVNERVVVQQLTPGITTEQTFVPNDSATVTVAAGGGDLAGTVVFRLYGSHDCSGTALYTSQAISVAGGTGTGLSRTVASDNTTAYGVSGDFSWEVTFTSTNNGHTSATHACGIERSSLDIDNSYVAP